MGNFNGQITEKRPEMEDILLEFIMSKPDEFAFLVDRKDGKIKISEVSNILFCDLLSGDKYYNATCKMEYRGKYHDAPIYIYEKELRLIERKHKLKKYVIQYS